MASTPSPSAATTSPRSSSASWTTTWSRTTPRDSTSRPRRASRERKSHTEAQSHRELTAWAEFSVALFLCVRFPVFSAYGRRRSGLAADQLGDGDLAGVPLLLRALEAVLKVRLHVLGRELQSLAAQRLLRADD